MADRILDIRRSFLALEGNSTRSLPPWESLLLDLEDAPVNAIVHSFKELHKTVQTNRKKLDRLRKESPLNCKSTGHMSKAIDDSMNAYEQSINIYDGCDENLATEQLHLKSLFSCNENTVDNFDNHANDSGIVSDIVCSDTDKTVNKTNDCFVSVPFNSFIVSENLTSSEEQSDQDVKSEEFSMQKLTSVNLSNSSALIFCEINESDGSSENAATTCLQSNMHTNAATNFAETTCKPQSISIGRGRHIAQLLSLSRAKLNM